MNLYHHLSNIPYCGRGQLREKKKVTTYQIKLGYLTVVFNFFFFVYYNYMAVDQVHS